MSNFIKENIHTLNMPTNVIHAARAFGLGDSNYQPPVFSGDAHGGFVKVEKEINSEKTRSIQICIALSECKTVGGSHDLLRAFIGGLGAGNKSEDWLRDLVKYAKQIQGDAPHSFTSEQISLTFRPTSEALWIIADSKASEI